MSSISGATLVPCWCHPRVAPGGTDMTHPVKTAISNSKSEILQKKISDCNGDQKKLFKIVDTLLGRNKHTTLPKYDSPLTMASVMNNFCIDKIDNIRAEFPSLEANLPCYSFLSMDSIMPVCTTILYHFDRVTDPEL